MGKGEERRGVEWSVGSRWVERRGEERRGVECQSVLEMAVVVVVVVAAAAGIMKRRLL